MTGKNWEMPKHFDDLQEPDDIFGVGKLAEIGPFVAKYLGWIHRGTDRNGDPLKCFLFQQQNDENILGIWTCWALDSKLSPMTDYAKDNDCIVRLEYKGKEELENGGEVHKVKVSFDSTSAKHFKSIGDTVEHEMSNSRKIANAAKEKREKAQGK